MKDDDAQQCNKILKALKEVFPNAIEGACGLLIGMYSFCLFVKLVLISHVMCLFCMSLTQGWKAHVFSIGKLETHMKREKCQNIVSNRQKWCYSWMCRDYVFNKDDIISKHLLLKYVNSKTDLAASIFNTKFIENIIKFLQWHILKTYICSTSVNMWGITWCHMHWYMR